MLLHLVQQHASVRRPLNPHITRRTEQVDERLGVIGIEVSANRSMGQIGIGNLHLQLAVLIEAVNNV